MMEDMNERILDVVAQQKAVYDELLEFAQLKKAVIIQGDAARLDAVITAEECLLLRLGELERQRGQLLESMAGRLGIEPEQLAITGIPWRDEGQRSRMQALQSSFSKTLESVRQVNDVNAQLLNMHLAYVQEVMDAVTQTCSAPSYNAGGDLNQRRMQSASLYDRIL